MNFEETIRQIVREEVRAAVSDAVKNLSIPMQQEGHKGGLSVKEAAEILGFGVNKVYELTRRPGFPAIRDGWKIIIPAHGLYRWMDEESKKNTGAAAIRA